MIPSNYKATIAIIAAYLTLNIAYAMNGEPGSGEPHSSLYNKPKDNLLEQTKQLCLNGIVDVFDYKFKNEEENNNNELTAKMCLDIAIRKFSREYINTKYGENSPALSSSTEMGLNYYRLFPQVWNTTDVKSPVNFCEANELCLAELNPIFGKISSHLSLGILYWEVIIINDYTNLYIEHVIEKVKFFETMEPVSYCKEIGAPMWISYEDEENEE